MSTIEKSIEVNVPVTIAYNQWTQFEQFPHFMEGVEEVRQIGDGICNGASILVGSEKSSKPKLPSSFPISGSLGALVAARKTPEL